MERPLNKLRLGVNIDHVATVRNARGGAVPDPVRAAVMAEEAAKQWTGTFNPRPVDVNSLRELYECAFTNETT